MCSRPFPTLIGLLLVSISPILTHAQKNKSIRLPVKNEGIYLLDISSHKIR
jgi:hypothetical protein